MVQLPKSIIEKEAWPGVLVRILCSQETVAALVGTWVVSIPVDTPRPLVARRVRAAVAFVSRSKDPL
jgi:hypothetical protein